MQLLAQFQIEPVDHPGDGSRRCRTQGLGKSPQRLFAMCRLDHNEARRIETKPAETLSVKAAVATSRVARHHQDDRISTRRAAKNRTKNRRDKAEGGSDCAFALRYNFMQRTSGQTAIRQVGIKRAKPERQGFTQAAVSRQQAA
jgi:hypothetical protein